ncbi:MAG: HXXEE domain-containing protein [Acidobacteriia bacterium]|nr:HXXEE domain-containing protein [Terriglobia bacterium]
MERTHQRVFLCLILAQGAHSVEEYSARLWEVLAPARFVSSLFSSNLPLGFLIFNAAVVSFGVWCWAAPVRRRWHAARAIAWFWTLLELGNGIGHLILAWSQGGYFPGAATAPLLIFFAAWLAILQVRPGTAAPQPAPR